MTEPFTINPNTINLSDLSVRRIQQLYEGGTTNLALAPSYARTLSFEALLECLKLGITISLSEATTYTKGNPDEQFSKDAESYNNAFANTNFKNSMTWIAGVFIGKKLLFDDIPQLDGEPLIGSTQESVGTATPKPLFPLDQNEIDDAYMPLAAAELFWNRGMTDAKIAEQFEELFWNHSYKQQRFDNLKVQLQNAGIEDTRIQELEVILDQMSQGLVERDIARHIGRMREIIRVNPEKTKTRDEARRWQIVIDKVVRRYTFQNPENCDIVIKANGDVEMAEVPISIVKISETVKQEYATLWWVTNELRGGKFRGIPLTDPEVEVLYSKFTKNEIRDDVQARQVAKNTSRIGDKTYATLYNRAKRKIIRYLQDQRITTALQFINPFTEGIAKLPEPTDLNNLVQILHPSLTTR